MRQWLHLALNKVDFRTKNIAKDRIYFIMKGSINPGTVIMFSVYALNNGASKYKIGLKGEGQIYN